MILAWTPPFKPPDIQHPRSHDPFGDPQCLFRIFRVVDSDTVPRARESGPEQIFGVISSLSWIDQTGIDSGRG